MEDAIVLVCTSLDAMTGNVENMRELWDATLTV